ncbi:hypothetical protein AVEN_11010-1 [Araneus ventricosus]|uniref:Tc1-like transposase DDE domain-containing protein n=1 Tax=Araneus ventricosus TaxID=182803 RepID=A0A4Y2HG92_ARAVE|nr:hypothetical protein AVEN_11010-1 [Araneus ventricosus]
MRYIRQQISDKAVGSVPAATMAGYQDLNSDEFGQFQQDSATPHTSRVATKWHQEHFSDIRQFHCPPKPPDMNIIEPIWVALQCAVQKRSPPPGTTMHFRTALKD